MSLSMYEVSIPAFIRAFGNLSAILDKGAAFAQAQGMDPADLIQTRLVADMDPLPAQVQRASDSAKGCAARLAGIEMPSFADTETTFPELQERIARTVAFLNTIQPAQLEGSETRTIEPAAPRARHARWQVLLAGLCAAELLFSRDHGLRHPAPQGRAGGQARLPRPVLIERAAFAGRLCRASMLVQA